MLDPDSRKMWATAANTGAVGLEIAVAIVIGYVGGRYLDRKLGTAPWFMWIGFAAGIGAGVKALVRVTRKYLRENPDDTTRNEDEH